MTTTVPVVRLAGVVVSVQFGQSVCVVKGVGVVVLGADNDTVVSAVTTVVAVDCDSVLNAVGVAVVSVMDTGT